MRAGTDELTQDEDVLDTWFSSALWPFATMGWPNETPDLAYFYPTDMLTTAGEILRLWVARMLMTGLEFRGGKPFADVYIHATVLDKKGRRMSKSKGNGIDPVDMIEKYGADALRFSLLRLASKGQDIRFSEERVPEARNFGNKIWNAARFVLLNLGEEAPPAPNSGGSRNGVKSSFRALPSGIPSKSGSPRIGGGGGLPLPARALDTVAAPADDPDGEHGPRRL